MFDEMRSFYLKSLPIFRCLPEQQLNEIGSVVKFKQVYRGETINYGSGEFSKIYFVIKGKIKLTELDELDNELVKDILTDGEVFGDLELEGDPKNPHYVLTVRGVGYKLNENP